jgi:hypothetical protein
MERMATIERPGLLIRIFFAIGRRMFGRVPTPQRLMARRLPLMLGMGGLYGAIEWLGTIDARLRALLNVQVAALYGVPY